MTDDGRMVWRPLAAVFIMSVAFGAGYEITRSAVAPLLRLWLRDGVGLLTLGWSVWALYTLWRRPTLPLLGIFMLAQVCMFGQSATRQLGKLTSGTPVSPFDWGFTVLAVLGVILMVALLIYPKGLRTLRRA